MERLVAVTLIGLAGASAGAEAQPVRGLCEPGQCLITERNVPKEYQKALDFLEFIKFPHEPTGMFVAAEAPHWNVEKFMSFLSSTRPLIFTDVNTAGTVSMTRKDVAASLARRKGKAFRTFARLAHIYSVPYRQYSELAFEEQAGAVVVHLGNYWYDLTFIREDGVLKLARCDYTTLEGD